MRSTNELIDGRMATLRSTATSGIGGAIAGTRQLFLDTCDSELLPSGVTTSNIIQYDSTNKARSFNVNGENYRLPNTETLASDVFFLASILAPSVLEIFAIRIYLNGTERYRLQFQSDGNIVAYRMPGASLIWATSTTGNGLPYLINEKWRTEISININRVYWRMWLDNWSKPYATGTFSHSHFTANSSDTVQFRLASGTTKISYIAVNKF